MIDPNELREMANEIDRNSSTKQHRKKAITMLSNRVFVNGPAGIGKTVFAKHWATRFKSKHPVEYEDQYHSYFYMPTGLGKQSLEESFADYHSERRVIWRNVSRDIDRRGSWAESRYPRIDEQIFTATNFSQLEVRPQDMLVHFSQSPEQPNQTKMTIRFVGIAGKIVMYNGVINATVKADADTFGETAVRYCQEAHRHSLMAPVS